MVVYGEGRYACAEHGQRQPRAPGGRRPGRRPVRQRAAPTAAGRSTGQLVDEDARLDPRSSYAASKVAQEHYASAWARQAGGAAVALRYHNVYGPGMPADTPYSGVAAMFRSALERGEPPRVFEDGGQMRDFVHVDDVARANVLAIERSATGPEGGSRRLQRLLGHTGLDPEVAAPRRRRRPRSRAEVTGRVPARRRPAHRRLARNGARRARVRGRRSPPSEGLAAFATEPLRA